MLGVSSLGLWRWRGGGGGRGGPPTQPSISLPPQAPAWWERGASQT